MRGAPFDRPCTFFASTLGADVVQTRGGEDIGLAAEALWCDVRAFDEAIARGALADALELYRGDLLDGFFVAYASSDFEEWLEKERVRLRQRATVAAWSLSDQHGAAGRGAQAAEWARWAAARAPDDERAQRRLMTLLDRQGDRTGALRVYEQLAQRAQAEFEAEPSAESRALVASIRARDTVSAVAGDRGVDSSCRSNCRTSGRRAARSPHRRLPRWRKSWSRARWLPISSPRLRPCRAAPPIALSQRAPDARRRWIPAAAAALAIGVVGLRDALGAGAAAASRTGPSTADSPARPRGAASSPVASSFFDEGLRALYDKGDAHLAHSLFVDALKADTGFAMAAFYVARTDDEGSIADASEMMARAMRLGAHARERERLIIKTQWAMMTEDPERMAVAESLATRYPSEPEGHIALASVLSGTGDFLGAVPHLKRVIAGDSLTSRNAPPFCAACVASEQLVASYLLADSLVGGGSGRAPVDEAQTTVDDCVVRAP